MMALLAINEIPLLIIGIIFLAFLVYTLHHITTRNLPASSKFLWFLVVILLCPVGMVLYYLIAANRVSLSN